MHHNRWKAREESQMLPILVPNIGFKEFSEIKPNVQTWLKSIEADLDSLESIYSDKKETYTGINDNKRSVSLVYEMSAFVKIS